MARTRYPTNPNKPHVLLLELLADLVKDIQSLLSKYDRSQFNWKFKTPRECLNEILAHKRNAKMHV